MFNNCRISQNGNAEDWLDANQPPSIINLHQPDHPPSYVGCKCNTQRQSQSYIRSCLAPLLPQADKAKLAGQTSLSNPHTSTFYKQALIRWHVHGLPLSHASTCANLAAAPADCNHREIRAPARGTACRAAKHHGRQSEPLARNPRPPRGRAGVSPHRIGVSYWTC